MLAAILRLGNCQWLAGHRLNPRGAHVPLERPHLSLGHPLGGPVLVAKAERLNLLHDLGVDGRLAE